MIIINKCKLRLGLLLVSSIIAMNIFGQLDTTKFNQTLSLYATLDQNKGLIDVCSFCNSSNKQLAVLYLKSNGFKQIIIGAKYVNKISITANERDTIDKSNEKPFTCYYVVAYNIEQDSGKTILKLFIFMKYPIT